MPQNEVIPTPIAPRMAYRRHPIAAVGALRPGCPYPTTSRLSGRSHGHIPGISCAVAMEWLLVGFVWFGLRCAEFGLLDLLGERKSACSAALRISGSRLVSCSFPTSFWRSWRVSCEASTNRYVRSMLPHGGTEIAVYLVARAYRGFCRRSRLPWVPSKTILGLTGSGTVAIVLQGIVFGAAHGYQGLKYMVIIAAFGCLFGVLAYWRRSLLPGMVAHFLQDGLVGLLAGLATK